MDLSKIYFDSNGKKGNILQIVALEPEWAANRIQEGEKAIVRLDEMRVIIAELEAQLAASQAECERLRIQLAACGVAANANTWESAAEMRLNDKSPYWSESYSDVCNAVNREIEHRGAATVLAKEREELREQLAAAQERARVLNDDLYYACELAIAYAHSAADQEWAAKRIEELMPPEQEADHDHQ